MVKGEVLAVLRDEDVLVRGADLEAAGLQNVAGRRESIGGETFVSLGSLAPALRYELDPQALALNVTAEPTLLASTALNLGAARPSGIDDRADPSAFFRTLTELNEAPMTGKPTGLHSVVHHVDSAAKRLDTT